MLYGLGGMAVCFTLLTSMFCFKVNKKNLRLCLHKNHLHVSSTIYPGGFL